MKNKRKRLKIALFHRKKERQVIDMIGLKIYYVGLLALVALINIITIITDSDENNKLAHFASLLLLTPIIICLIWSW